MLKKNIINFLLCPDRSSSRRLKRFVAEQSPMTNIIIGTWPELVQHVRAAYLLGDVEETWSSELIRASSSFANAFWSESFRLAESETVGILNNTLSLLIAAAGPGKTLEEIKGEGLSSRGNQHLADLVQLHKEMGCLLPPDLLAIHEVLATDRAHTLCTMRVLALASVPELNPWQQALLDKLNQDGGEDADPRLQALLDKSSAQDVHSDCRPALTFLQNNLYTIPEKSQPLDGSIQWLAARDYLQEAEVVAGMVQKALHETAGLKPAQIGLLLPDDPRYALAIKETFTRAGLPLAGLIEQRDLRDLGRELIFYLLLTLKKPAPAMAFAALLASPLLPWGRTQGLVLAQAVMDGNFRLQKMDWPVEGKLLLKQLVVGVDGPNELLSVLELIAAGLPSDEALSGAVEVAGNIVCALQQRLVGSAEIAWEELIALAAPAANLQQVEGDVFIEGIAVFQEGQETWRPVRQLFVLGFNHGHYPRGTGFSPVFSDADLAKFKQSELPALKTASDIANESRQRFVRQLRTAAEKIRFLMSRRDAFGKSLGPSASLTFMAQLFGLSEPEELVLELDTDAGRQQAEGLALTEPRELKPARVLDVSDLDLGRDLLSQKTREDGSLYPMSPSGLETLMVSPLAWVIGRAGLEPPEWAPEELDVASKGTLAHAVFEWLFPVGETLPKEEAIRKQVPVLLNRAIVTIKPFLLSPEWQVERNHLENEVLIAALRWQALLEQLGARIIGVEAWLSGDLDGIPLHGAADLLLGLPDGRLFVVDYKKSKSKQRKERMLARYDSQATLYRIMLETGGITSKKSDDVDAAVKQAKEIGVLYYLMNDQVALTDTDAWLTNGLDGVEELAGDVSSEALKLIRQRLAEMRKGKVSLNTMADADWYYDNAGITLYALEKSPLIKLFMQPAPEEQS